jgi:hypothetical protein
VMGCVENEPTTKAETSELRSGTCNNTTNTSASCRGKAFYFTFADGSYCSPHTTGTICTLLASNFCSFESSGVCQGKRQGTQCGTDGEGFPKSCQDGGAAGAHSCFCSS